MRKIYLVSFTHNKDGLNTDLYATDEEGIKKIVKGFMVGYQIDNIEVDLEAKKVKVSYEDDIYDYYIYELKHV